ncbi:Grx4 family monothiol glutaredoxin [Thiomicrorhabdus sp. zzn3]|uniref:Grx4 family monothiol glutaredoxin n=1 Tax=Thiomicrorhabdus sp. zzn3 TaxID=3039775 RepID=UPI0024368A60|nr:Grx4 family monothiol glutaredoxin [Thiomicrorhabdus sp. zzn3]MDG6778472.1 Grx4 family monothiol glutaredoxin [Thiomicrorhabdus sp. zzn3]
MSDSLEKETLERIDQQVKNNPVVLYMKGTPQMPSCGFSSRAAQALVETGEKFAFVNILADAAIFEHLPKYQDWPTFPQLYIDGELQGGCDITLELAESGELKKMMAEANAKSEANAG